MPRPWPLRRIRGLEGNPQEQQYRCPRTLAYLPVSCSPALPSTEQWPVQRVHCWASSARAWFPLVCAAIAPAPRPGLRLPEPWAVFLVAAVFLALFTVRDLCSLWAKERWTPSTGETAFCPCSSLEYGNKIFEACMQCTLNLESATAHKLRQHVMYIVNIVSIYCGQHSDSKNPFSSPNILTK